MDVKRSSIFWDITLCSPMKVSQRFRGTCHRALLATCFTLVSSLAYPSTLKMEETCSSKILVYFEWTSRCYIPELSMTTAVTSDPAYMNVVY
jgi:hypothetical protein